MTAPRSSPDINARQQVLLATLQASSDEMSGQQLHRSLEPDQAMGLATVYRNLRQLQQRGLVRCRHLPNGEALYAPLERIATTSHVWIAARPNNLTTVRFTTWRCRKMAVKASICCSTRLNSLVSAATAKSGSKARHDSGRYVLRSQWLVAQFNDLRVLVDPWLRGSLSFPPGAWFLKGELACEHDVPENLDLLLLTQGLADHAHPETLALLPKTLPVIGSVAATRVVERLGFTTVKALSPGEVTTHQGLQVRASAGAPVPVVENGYLLNHPAGTLYLEPHGFLDPTLEPQTLDAVITPMVDLGLPALGAFVKGCSVVPQLVERFQPTTVLASTSGGDVRFGGALSHALQMKGSVADTGSKLPASSDWTDPQPGERLLLKI